MGVFHFRVRPHRARGRHCAPPAIDGVRGTADDGGHLLDGVPLIAKLQRVESLIFREHDVGRLLVFVRKVNRGRRPAHVGVDRGCKRGARPVGREVGRHFGGAGADGGDVDGTVRGDLDCTDTVEEQVGGLRRGACAVSGHVVGDGIGGANAVNDQSSRGGRVAGDVGGQAACGGLGGHPVHGQAGGRGLGHRTRKRHAGDRRGRLRDVGEQAGRGRIGHRPVNGEGSRGRAGTSAGTSAGTNAKVK
ncbi:hypothetical protein BU14_0311s0001 [Porphyra umbilicalis]|uniref:Uncharacterized protein n=1 Tax=Porphyra umbilicalis TaxID=2786 RepID=A0A1X6NZL7_PORUM|nr:hypothetical protein BU14_0311s0001 [Porphyra umbilicalis]|eukprot:OSX74061.1 hypothetical protein BU14_0311s0001 [Porphyra umbilicalis]